MMSWSPTPNREAIDALAVLWGRAEWRTSIHGSAIHSILLTMLDGPDDVNRLHVSQVARLLTDDNETAYELIRERLLTERHPYIATQLLQQLWTFSDTHTAAVDDTIAHLAQAPPWADMLVIIEGEHDLRDLLGVFIHLVLYLAIRHQKPAAIQLTQAWFTDPTRTQAAKQAVNGMREWLALSPDRATERARAFELLNIAITALIHLVDAAESDSKLLREAFKVADAIAHNLYFASGAHANNGEQVQIPDFGFADQALSTLRMLIKFKHPSIVHKIVETLNHIAPLDPQQAFLIVSMTIAPGDRYIYDALAAGEVIALVERYLAEFRELVVKDSELLDAIRSVLHAFVDAGWPSALNLTYHLSDAFR